MSERKNYTKVYCLVILLFIAGVSCKKTETITVNNNNPLINNEVSEISVTSFITKTYISLLGRKPTNTELTKAQVSLKQNNLSATSTLAFIESLQQTQEYKYNIYALAKIKYLNNLDTNEIQGFIEQAQIILTDSSKINDWPIYQISLDQLLNLQNAPKAIMADEITPQEVFKRCCLNLFYDEINMGAQNFVVSVYDHFLLRYPTQQELADGIEMIYGNFSTVLGKPGKNNEDFVNIVMANLGFYEGQVRELFLRYLYRQPNQEELIEHTQLFYSTMDYKKLQAKILTHDEFVGK